MTQTANPPAADATSARIDLLTAEVRTLMVGNRQVTLSVAKQLDRVDLETMQPFGRIRMGESPLVIGRSIATGSLVLARYETARTWRFDAFVDPEDLDGKQIKVCSATNEQHSRIDLKFEGANISVAREAIKPCGKGHVPGNRSERCEYWWYEDAHDEIAAVVKRSDDRWRLHVVAGDLPLIVLAGLR